MLRSVADGDLDDVMDFLIARSPADVAPQHRDDYTRLHDAVDERLWAVSRRAGKQEEKLLAHWLQTEPLRNYYTPPSWPAPSAVAMVRNAEEARRQRNKNGHPAGAEFEPTASLAQRAQLTAHWNYLSSFNVALALMFHAGGEDGLKAILGSDLGWSFPTEMKQREFARADAATLMTPNDWRRLIDSCQTQETRLSADEIFATEKLPRDITAMMKKLPGKLDVMLVRNLTDRVLPG